jgi:heme/copper-type cytochrome/quinol oxidase subunit 4
MLRSRVFFGKKIRFWVLLTTVAALILLLTAVPPYQTGAVPVFILAVTLCTVYLSSYFMRLRDSVLVGITVLFFLILNAYFGPNILNTILLISFVLGIRFLIQ